MYVLGHLWDPQFNRKFLGRGGGVDVKKQGQHYTLHAMRKKAVTAGWEHMEEMRHSLTVAEQ